MKKNQLIQVIVMVVVVLVSTGVWYTGAYKTLFSGEVRSQVGNTLALDLESLQLTIRTVSSPLIEELQFVEAIDTLNAHEVIKELRNPFVRVYVAPPPSEKPKQKITTSKKKSTPKRRKKRVVRPKIALTGIIWDRSNPYAILNNDIYGEGDIIQGYTVQTIQDTMIFLVNNDDLFSIVLERE